MTRAAALRALLLATSTIVPFTAFAQPSPSPATQSGTADAIRVLLDQATYWRGQSEDDKANVAISRVLVLDPNNVDALAMQAQAAADAGDQTVAAAALAKLKSIRPDDPRISSVEQALKTGPVDPAALADARALAAAKKPDEAIAAYRKAFRSDTPTPALASEYYQTLAATSVDWNVPRAGLAAVLRANPDNLNAQLAYAELLTYHDETRAEGIQRLGKLTNSSAIAAQATKALREAMFWLPPDPSSIPQYDVYLSHQPGDAGILKLKTAAENDPNSVRLAGYDALRAGDLAASEEQFNRSLAKNPNDSDALLGLALLRYKQKRNEEGRDLLRRVIELDPTKAAEFQKFVDAPIRPPVGQGGGYQGRNYTLSRADRARFAAIYGRRIRAQYARVAALANQGEFAQAEALLLRLSGRHPSLGNLAYLADLQARRGELGAAEGNYRAVLARSPRNVQALAGLAGVLAREGKQTEADAMFAQAAQLPGGAALGGGRANALRMQADQTSDPAAKIELYRSAVNAAPSDPWIRLDLARELARQQDYAGARAVMAPMVASAHPTEAQLQASIYFSNEIEDNGTVVKLVDRLPPKQQTPAMLNLRTSAQVRLDIQEARAFGNEEAERDRLLSLASQPDPSGIRVSTYSNELVKRGDKLAAREAIRIALAARTPTAEQRIVYGGALLGAGYPNEAKAITAAVVPSTPLMTQELSSVRNGAAVAVSDRLNAAGKPAAAYDELVPRLQQAPDNADLNMALARLYTSNRQPEKAIQITRGLMEQNPSNLLVRSTAVYANMADGDLRKANSIAEESTVQFPDEPQAWLDLANVERARGHTGNALRALQTAKALREKQLAGQQSAAEPTPHAPGVAAAEPLRRRYAQYALYIPPNTATDASPDPLPEPITRQYAQYDPNASAQLPIEGGAPATAPLVTRGYAPFDAVSPARASTGPAGSAFVAAPSGAPPTIPPAQSALQAQLQGPQISQFLDTPESSNPFASGSSPLPTPDEPVRPSGMSASPLLLQPTDSMTAQIDQSIAQVKEELAPRLDVSAEVRGRTGTPGFERLLQFDTPVEASFSPNDYGRLSVTVTPTYLWSGTGTNSFEVSQYGTNPLGTNASPAVRPHTQMAFGSALDVRYAYDIATADIGATPLGFREQTVVGGIELAPRLTQNITLRILAERRSVTDSILSYGGMKDYRTGETWGGVTRNHGHVQIEGLVGQVAYFAGAGGGYLDGHNVASNSEIDATMGGSIPVWHSATQEVRVGSQLIYFGYDKNLAGFSLGQGGYFSPQDYFAVLFPVTYRQQVTPDLRFSVGGTVGWQTYRSKSSDIFPNDSALQAQLVSQAAVTGVNTTLNGTHGAGVAGGANGEVDYRVNGNLHIGARVGFDHSGSFSEGTGLVYARYIFNDAL